MTETPLSSRVFSDQEKVGVAHLPSRRLMTGNVFNPPREEDQPVDLSVHAPKPVEANRESPLREVKQLENYMNLIPGQCIQGIIPLQVGPKPSALNTIKVEDPGLSSEKQVTANLESSPVMTRSGREVRAPMWFIIPSWNRRIE